MPECPPKPCVHPGCRNLAAAGKSRCDAHAQSYDRDIRAATPTLRQAQRIRSGHLWQTVRRNFRIANPVCCDPFKEHIHGPEGTSDIHHVIPLIERPDLAYTDSNLRPLCRPCHNRVEAMERRGEATQHLFTDAQTP